MRLTLSQLIKDLKDCNPNMEAAVVFKPGRSFTNKKGRYVSFSEVREYKRVYSRHPLQIVIELED
jgi:hypothetical protein